MESVRPSSLLRRVLVADAVTCVASGLLMTFGAGFLEELFGLPTALVRYSGLSLFPFAAFLVWVATREAVARPVLWAIVAANALWAADSVLMLVTGLVVPNGLGIAFVLAQALVVAAFAEAEYVFGLRRTAASAVR
jgi:hypothetical protein